MASQRSSSPVSSRGVSLQLPRTSKPPAARQAAGWPADDDYVNLTAAYACQEGSRLGSAERFDESQFRVARKLLGGPERLLDLICGSLGHPAGVEAFRSDTRRARHVLADGGDNAADMAGQDESVDQVYLSDANGLVAGIKQQLVARLSCRQAKWQPPIELRYLKLPEAGGPSDHQLTSFTGLPGCTVVATEDIPAWTFIDLYTGRVTTASSSSRPSANYTVVWRHEEDCIIIDGTKAGNILADVNDTAQLEVAVEEPSASSIIRAAYPTSSMSCTSQEVVGTLCVRPRGFKPDNVQLVSVRDANTGVVYVFMVSTRHIKRGEELLLDYDIGELAQPEWWQGPYLTPVQQLVISAHYKGPQDRRQLWDTVRAQLGTVLLLVEELNNSASPPKIKDTNHPVIERPDVQMLHEMQKARARLPSVILRLQQLVKNKWSAAQSKGNHRLPRDGAGSKLDDGIPAPAPPDNKEPMAEPSITSPLLHLRKRAASKDAEKTADSVLSDELQDLLITLATSPLTLQYANHASILITDSVQARKQQAAQDRLRFFSRLREYVQACLAKLRPAAAGQPSEGEMQLVLQMIERWLQQQA